MKKRIHLIRTGILLLVFAMAVQLTPGAFTANAESETTELKHHETNAEIGGDPANAVEIEKIEDAREDAWQTYGEGRMMEAFSDLYGQSLTYGDATMKIYVTVKGDRPKDGYPLYIALHGGGGSDTPDLNDNQWEMMKGYYSSALDCGVYIAPRGVSDTWNTHFNDESYPLYDRLIEDAILLYGIDPNKVYIEGFSAGGDGVYQIAARMADRFAAANMSAGHPNGVSMVNLKNLGFQIQVGENDSSYKRNTVAAEYGGKLAALQEQYGGYPHRTHIHKDKGHNFADSSKTPLEVMKDPQAWLAAVKAGESYTETISEDSFPPDYMDQFTRDPLAEEVVWNLGSRAGSRSVESFYWLTAPMTTNKGTIVASYDKSQNLVKLETNEVDGDFSVLLNEEMIDFSKPVTFMLDDAVVTANVIPDKTILKETTEERGDPNYQFESKVSYSKLLELVNHSMEKTKAKAADCENDGNIEYWTCSLCGKSFSDEAGTTEVDIQKSTVEGGVIIEAIGHSWGDWTKKDDNDHERICGNDANHTGTAAHTWDEGSVTTEPTADDEGVRTYTCTVCGGTKTENIPATGESSDSDEGTNVGSDTNTDTNTNTNNSTNAGTNTNNGTGSSNAGNTGAGNGTTANTAADTNTGAGSAAAAEAAIYSMTSDTDIAGSDILTLRLRSTKQGKNSIKLTWKGASGAVKYVVYGNRCGKANRMKKLGETTANRLNVTNIEGARLKKGTYHKFIVVAVDAAGNIIAASKTIHVATKGGKVGNYSSIKISNSKKLKSIKAGKSVKIKAKASGSRVKKHVGLRYESSNPAVATVTKAGKVKAVSKGTATIIVYAQNGVSKQIKISIK